MKKIVVLFLFAIPLLSLAQEKKEKLKGSKIVELKSYEVSDFTSIEVGDFFEVQLVEKSKPSLSIDADNNFHNYIDAKVINGKLEITTTKHFQRYKRLLIEIGVNSKLSSIFVKGKAKVFNTSKIEFEDLNIESFENSKIDISFSAKKTSFYAKDKSEIKLKGQSDSLFINTTDSADMSIDVKTKNTSVLQALKSKLVLTGSSDNSIIQISGDGFLNASDFVSLILMLTAIENADSYINVADKVTLDVKGKSETHILGTPLVNLKSFKDSASIYKTDKAPSTLKSFLN